MARPEENAPAEEPSKKLDLPPEHDPYQPIDFDPEEFGLELDDEEEDGLKIYEHYRITVDPKQEPLRVDQFLSNRVRHISRSRIKHAAQAGFIRINRQQVKVSQKVKPGDVVSIILPYPPKPDLIPQPIPLNIVYEDDQLIVLNKQAGLVCHPGIGNYSGTLVNGLLHYFQHMQLPQAEKEGIRPGLVHRLDKDTSGLLVVAKTEQAHDFLAAQFFNRTTDRLYYALVWGDVKEDAGTIEANIIRSPSDPKRYTTTQDSEQGKHAVTHYRVIQRFGVATLVQCKLQTGRTHQIRVHLKSLGHTLFSDSFYGGDKLLRGKPSRAFQRFIQSCLAAMPRQALHAKTLGFEHPTSGDRLFFNSPLPEDFSTLILMLCQFFGHQPHPDLELSPVTLPQGS